MFYRYYKVPALSDIYHTLTAKSVLGTCRIFILVNLLPLKNGAIGFILIQIVELVQPHPSRVTVRTMQPMESANYVNGRSLKFLPLLGEHYCGLLMWYGLL